MEDPAVWLTKREAAALARVSVRTVERAIASGKLRASKSSGRVRIHRRWVDAWLAGVLTILLVLLLIFSQQLGCAVKPQSHSHARHHREHVFSREADVETTPLGVILEMLERE